jgi:hypothetical protein
LLPFLFLGQGLNQQLSHCNCIATNTVLGNILKTNTVDAYTRFNIRFALLNPLPANSTRNLIVAFSGQNGIIFGFDGGGASNVTGQPDQWPSGCGNLGCGFLQFNPEALTSRLLGLFGTTNSMAVVFPDHKYEALTGNSIALNENIANSITQYIKSLVNPSFVTNIVITGHSRGGCLTLTVARKLRQDAAFAGVRLIAVPFDAICVPERFDVENWVNRTVRDPNPLNPPPIGGILGFFLDLFNAQEFYGWRSEYPQRSNLGDQSCVAHVLSGETYTPFRLHSLSLASDPTGGLHRFNNFWTRFRHLESGISYSPDIIAETIAPAYCFVANNMAPVPPPPPPPAECNSDPYAVGCELNWCLGTELPDDGCNMATLCQLHPEVATGNNSHACNGQVACTGDPFATGCPMHSCLFVELPDPPACPTGLLCQWHPEVFAGGQEHLCDVAP